MAREPFPASTAITFSATAIKNHDVISSGHQLIKHLFAIPFIIRQVHEFPVDKIGAGLRFVLQQLSA